MITTTYNLVRTSSPSFADREESKEEGQEERRGPSSPREEEDVVRGGGGRFRSSTSTAVGSSSLRMPASKKARWEISRLAKSSTAAEVRVSLRRVLEALEVCDARGLAEVRPALDVAVPEHQQLDRAQSETSVWQQRPSIVGRCHSTSAINVVGHHHKFSSSSSSSSSKAQAAAWTRENRAFFVSMLLTYYKGDRLSMLPKDVVCGCVLSFCELPLLARLASVSRATRSLADSDASWRSAYERAFGLQAGVTLHDYGASLKESYHQRIRDPTCGDRVEVAWQGRFRLEGLEVYRGLAWWAAEVAEKRAESDDDDDIFDDDDDDDDDTSSSSEAGVDGAAARGGGGGGEGGVVPGAPAQNEDDDDVEEEQGQEQDDLEPEEDAVVAPTGTEDDDLQQQQNAAAQEEEEEEEEDQLEQEAEEANTTNNNTTTTTNTHPPTTTPPAENDDENEENSEPSTTEDAQQQQQRPRRRRTNPSGGDEQAGRRREGRRRRRRPKGGTARRRYKVHYLNWDARWDEWVSRDQLRWPVQEGKTCAVDPGDDVEVWCSGNTVPGAWLRAVVDQVDDELFCVGNVASSGHLWVSRDRVRLVRRKASEQNDDTNGKRSRFGRPFLLPNCLSAPVHKLREAWGRSNRTVQNAFACVLAPFNHRSSDDANAPENENENFDDDDDDQDNNNNDNDQATPDAGGGPLPADHTPNNDDDDAHRARRHHRSRPNRRHDPREPRAAVL
eukprot:CAMPEP_0118918810 /NCGR_PEP_ID=MMETSP1166-20130328/18158_1 /TAXON_ID=1104430 /ORGANISM="Chrysoreinhardia sp, Strain CCMP3193" /LENGTH=727 /DNA_ID=CAMNT_0006859197 /DNA_START=71 /DNA_END=2254 /DNA_ORIENTATION=+